MKRTSGRVIVNIDRLVLYGVRYEDRYAVAQGLQQQLTQLFSQPGVAHRVGKADSIPRLRVGQVRTGTKVRPQEIGFAAANGIAKGLNR